MTDTQADLTKRARAMLGEWFEEYPDALVEKIAAIAQSEREAAADFEREAKRYRGELQIALAEREAAAAEARKAALEEAATDCMEWYATTGNKDCRYAYKNAAVSIRALASPAPQEETRAK